MQRVTWILLAAALALISVAPRPVRAQDERLRTLDIDKSINMMQGSLANRGDKWKCSMKVVYACTPLGCSPIQDTLWIDLDFPNHRYSRCNEKGCDAFDFEFVQNGMYTIARLSKTAVMLKVMNDGSRFLEIASSGSSTYNSFGSCKPE